MIEQKTTIGKIKDLCIQRLNYKHPKVVAGDTEVGYGDFIKRNNPVKFQEEVDSFIVKLKELKVLDMTPASDPKNQYYFTKNTDAHMGVLKYID